MDALFLFGRVLFAAVFLFLGAALLTPASGEGSDGERRGATAALLGGGMVTGAALIAAGALADLGAILVALPTAALTAVRHRFWLYRDAAQRQASFTNFIKNVALVGAAAVIFFTFNQLQGDAPLSLTDPLFARL
jgi:putative oxidoreductase